MNLSDARNEADAILLAVQRALGSQAWQQLRDEEKVSIRVASGHLESVKDGDDVAAICQATEALDLVTLRFAELMMEAAAMSASRGKTEGRT